MKDIHYPINIFTPDLVNVCVDRSMNGEIVGRLYHRYQEEPLRFSNLVDLLRLMEQFFDAIQFPQASTMSRSFRHPQPKAEEIYSEAGDPEMVLRHTGEAASFVVNVAFRQNSTWQGEVYWVEAQRLHRFSSTLDFIKILDGSLMEKVDMAGRQGQTIT